MTYEPPMPQPSRGPPDPTGEEELRREAAAFEHAMQVFLDVMQTGGQPSPWELISTMEAQGGRKIRWRIKQVLEYVRGRPPRIPSSLVTYANSILASPDFVKALCGTQKPGKVIETALTELLQQSAAHRTSSAFQATVSFIARFRDYAPFNNMLIRYQNPSSTFFATEKDWRIRFGRTLKEDAKAMVILAPMSPVMFVYDVDETEGRPLPKDLEDFSKVTGNFDPTRLSLLEQNAQKRDLIKIGTKQLSQVASGFATIATGKDKFKMRIVLHDALDPPSRYSVLAHELAHVFLGHLGGDPDLWWPARGNLSLRAMEIEAEAVAYIVTRRAGLLGTHDRYISTYIRSRSVPADVSVDLIAKVAGRIETMSLHRMAAHRKSKRKPDVTNTTDLFQ